MHILFLTDNFPPEVNAPASRTYEHAKVWTARGAKVTVITCAPNFPGGKVHEGYRNRLWQEEETDGIRVIRVWSYITANEGFTKRTLDYISYMVMACLAAIFVRRVDLIVATSPQFFTALGGWIASGLKWKPWVFELRDIWPESIRAVGASKNERLLDWLEKLELFLYRRSSAVIAVTHAFRRNLGDRGIDTDKVHVVTNGVDRSRFQPIPRDEALKAELGLTGKKLAGYVGTHGMAHGLTTLLDAAEKLQDRDDLQLVFLGAGAERAQLIEDAQARGLQNVTFLEPVPKSEIARYWSLLDISIVHLRPDPLFKTVIPSKIFECMGMGVPIAMGVEGESRDIVLDAGAGSPFAPGDAAELAGCLTAMIDDEAGLAAMAAAGPLAVGKFDRTVLAESMLDILQSISNPLTADSKNDAQA